MSRIHITIYTFLSFRAFGPFALGNYWYEFNDQSKNLLKDFSLNGRSLWRDQDVNPTSETIGWSQFSRCWWWCEEEYLLVDYYKDGNKENQVFKVALNFEFISPR